MLKKKLGCSSYCIPEDSIDNDKKNNDIQMQLFLLAKKSCDSVRPLTFDWQGSINAKCSFLLRLKPMRKKPWADPSSKCPFKIIICQPGG